MSAASTAWIVSPRYDLFWFFGGAVLSLLALSLYFGAGIPIVVLWWVWLLAFDGPHIGAAFTRTYLDRDEWHHRRGVLLTGLAVFLIGPTCLILNVAAGSPQPFLLYLGAATLYGYYHVVRQHYGFLALYKARGRDYSREHFHTDKWFLYAGCWLPYIYLLLTHPSARRLIGLKGMPAGIEQTGATILVSMWGAAVLLFIARTLVQDRYRFRRPPVLYVLLTVLLYGLTYFGVAHYEPVYAQSQGPDQDFLLISVLIVIFHNVQYFGLVWFHNRNRYGSAAEDFGLATAVNRSFGRYAMLCLGFSGVVYFLFAAMTGVFPHFQLFVNSRFGAITASQIGLCLWWGLAINHYYIDQKIWRVRGDATLKRNLELA